MFNKVDRLILQKKSKNFWSLSDVVSERSRLDGAFHNQETYALYACGYIGRAGMIEPRDTYRSSPVQANQTADFYVEMGMWSNNQWGIMRRYDDTLWGWGSNGNGELAQNDTLSEKAYLVQIPGVWKQFSVGSSHCGAIDVGQNLFVWGANGSGQLGQGTTAPRSSPVQVPGKWKKVSCGGSHTFAVDIFDNLYVWGYNDQGQLGQEDTRPRSSPVQIPGKWGTLMTLSNYSSYFTSRTGHLWVTGYNNNGQLGLGDTIHRSSPCPGILAGWTAMSCSDGSFAGVIKNGEGTRSFIWSMGDNGYGQLGHGDTYARSNPVMIQMRRSSSVWTSNLNMRGPEDEWLPWHSVHMGGYDMKIIDQGGGMWATGYDYQGNWPTNDYTKYSNSMTNFRVSSPVFIGARFAVCYENPEQAMGRQCQDGWVGLKENIDRFEVPRGIA